MCVKQKFHKNMTLDYFIVISQHITEALLNEITKREEHKKKKDHKDRTRLKYCSVIIYYTITDRIKYIRMIVHCIRILNKYIHNK